MKKISWKCVSRAGCLKGITCIYKSKIKLKLKMHKHSTQLLMQHRQCTSEIGGFNNGTVPTTTSCMVGGMCPKRQAAGLQPLRRWNSFHSRDRQSNTMSASIEHFRQHQQKLKNSIMISGSAPSASALGAAAGLMGVAAGAGAGLASERSNSRSVPRVMALRSESSDVPSARIQHPPPPPAFPRRRFSVW